MVNSNVGYAVGDWGTLLKSVDGGIHWSSLNSPGNYRFMSVWFSDPLHGWVTGANLYWLGTGSAIFHTNDGGLTWQCQYNNISKDLIYDITFTDPLHGYAAGDRFIAVTHDGGQNWLTQNIDHSLIAIDFANDSTGWASGPFGVIYKTTDYGETWVKQPSTSTALINSICFLNDSVGMMVGNGGRVLQTNNAGNTWTWFSIPGGLSLQDVVLLNDTTAIVVGGYYSTVCLKTTDNGATWISVDVPTSAPLNGICFIDQTTGWCVGDDGKILVTGDGGESWEAQSRHLTQEWLKRVQFVDSLTGWTVGGNAILKTSDGGKNWEALPNDSSWHFENLRFLNSNIGWVVGNDKEGNEGIVAKTTDGGISWERQNTPGMTKVYGISFLSSDTGWIAGSGASYQGIIMQTTNGGDEWNIQFTDNHMYFTDISCVDYYHIRAIRQLDNLTFTNDGGETWTNAYTGAGQYLYKTLFLSDSTGWIAGWYTLAKTTDLGGSWDWQYSSADIYDLCFFDAYTGWAVGEYIVAVILKTFDGGDNWMKMPVPTDKLLYGIDFPDANHGWIVGWGGTILHSANGGGYPVGVVNHREPDPARFYHWQVFPNPTTSIIKIKGAESQSVNIALFDPDGRMVLEAKSKNIPQSIDVNHLNSGVYFLVITSMLDTEIIKILKI